MNRRSFLVKASALGGGLALTLTIPSLAKELKQDSGHCNTDSELAPWLKIDANGKVTVRVTHTEIGNGAITQIAMNIAEELGCDWANIATEQASVQRDYLSGGTDYSIGFQPWFGGHSTNPERMQYALQVGASARERLKMAAAHRWKVDVNSITVIKGQLIHSASNRSLGFGQVAEAAALITLEQEPTPKKPEDWTLIGKQKPTRLHVPAVTKGCAIYGIDVQIPGMLYATIKQCPVHGGKLISVDTKKVLQMPGVRKVVTLDASKTAGTPVKDQSTFGLRMTETASGVAVVADHYWQAKKALDALEIEWELGPGTQWQSAQQAYNEAQNKLKDNDGRVIKNVGNESQTTPSNSLNAEYGTPFCEHMTMEPLNGTAVYHEDKLEIWFPTQDVKQIR